MLSIQGVTSGRTCAGLSPYEGIQRGLLIFEGDHRTYDRSEDLRVYVRRRADGRCEGCGSPAPFLTTRGHPYLEPHHTRRLSDDGPDDSHHVIALCPTCHRRVHHAADGDNYNGELRVKLDAIEPR